VSPASALASSAGQRSASGPGPAQHVVVLLRDQDITSNGTAAQSGLQARDRAVSDVRSAAGGVSREYQLVNGFAASVSPTEATRLAANPDVLAVIADSAIQMPDSQSAGQPAGATSPSKSAPVKTVSPSSLTQAARAGLCPSNPGKPLVEPESLQLTNTAFANPRTPQAQDLATGKGVKVAFFGDGVDTSNPDFVRPDGSKVFVDYRDFTGDGPDAPISGEGYIDSSAIAAQGRRVYDLSTFVSTSHPLPHGCTITIRGVAPGASLVGMQVVTPSNYALLSSILEAFDWAVSVDHVDVLNESFGSLPMPDTARDAIGDFDERAVAAGVTVVASSGDFGQQNMITSPGSVPGVIGVGATTQFQSYAQMTWEGYQLAGRGWASDNISSFSSAGFTQSGHTIDLVAGGDIGWTLCDPAHCANFNGDPTTFSFGEGSSQAAPQVAGAAALVIQAYRDSHHGNRPAPQVVEQILTSTARDLGLPSDVEGFGELDSLAAVRMARSMPNGSGPAVTAGPALVVRSGQVDVSAPAGTASSATIALTNTGLPAQTVTTAMRSLGTAHTIATGRVTLDASVDPTIVNGFGAPESYRTIRFTVPAAADRLDGAIAWNAQGTEVDLSLVDPHGRYVADTETLFPGGGYAHVEVTKPTVGVWTAVLRTPGYYPPLQYNGTVQYAFTTANFTTSRSSSAVTIAPHATRSIPVTLHLPGAAGDSSRDLVLSTNHDVRSVIPVVLRSEVALNSHGGGFAGTLTGGDGLIIAEQHTIAFTVPPGEPELTVAVTVSNNDSSEVAGDLIDPSGELRATPDTVRPDSSGNLRSTHSLEAYRDHPAPGRWLFTIEAILALNGPSLSGTYTGHIGFDPPNSTTTGIPATTATVLPAGLPHSATITIVNTGVASEELTIDPRLAGIATVPLIPPEPVTNLPFPFPVDQPALNILVPPKTTSVTAQAVATQPVAFSWGPFDPLAASTGSGNVATGTIADPEVANGYWYFEPAPVGPFTAPPPAGTVSLTFTAQTRAFDQTVSTSTGNLWASTVDANAPPVTPAVVEPGQSVTLTLTFTPTGASGDVVSGDVYVEDSCEVCFGSAEVVAIPYEYTIG
jgi:hypothetical protein